MENVFSAYTFENFLLIGILNMNNTFSITRNRKYKPVLSLFSTVTQHSSNADVLLDILRTH